MYFGKTARNSNTGATIAARRALEKHTLMRNARLISLRLKSRKKRNKSQTLVAGKKEMCAMKVALMAIHRKVMKAVMNQERLCTVSLIPMIFIT